MVLFHQVCFSSVFLFFIQRRYIVKYALSFISFLVIFFRYSFID